MQPTESYLSLGSNLGDRLNLLRQAVRKIEQHKKITLRAVSTLYETEPVGNIQQPAFYNVVIHIETVLSPQELLRCCQNIEQDLGRERTVRWGPRTMDIDILTYGDLNLATPQLTLPHPEMHQREFVLIPLRELQDGHSGCSRTVRPRLKHWLD